jgi:hypothetical protein
MRCDVLEQNYGPYEFGDPMKAIVIVAPLGYVASMPFFMEIVQQLADRGVRVELVTLSDLDPILELSAANLSVREAPTAGSSFFHKIRTVIGLIWHTRKAVRSTPNLQWVLALSQLGLIVSLIGVLGTRVRIAYLNDELWFDDYDGGKFYKLRKCLEQLGTRRSMLIVTQDKDRGRLLAKINKVSRDGFLYLPNSRAGLGELRRSSVVHDLIGCGRDKKLVMWLGAASEGDGALQIAEQARSWPPEYLFVYHFRSSSPTAYKRKLIELNGVGQNRYISEPFNYAEVESLYASAHIGLAIYPKRGINAEYIGHSSGKLNTFLKAGVPCIVSKSRGLSWAVRTAGCVAVDSVGDLLSAIQLIERDYEERSLLAISAYNEQLAFEPHFDRLVRGLGIEGPGR